MAERKSRPDFRESFLESCGRVAKGQKSRESCWCVGVQYHSRRRFKPRAYRGGRSSTYLTATVAIRFFFCEHPRSRGARADRGHVVSRSLLLRSRSCCARRTLRLPPCRARWSPAEKLSGKFCESCGVVLRKNKRKVAVISTESLAEANAVLA